MLGSTIQEPCIQKVYLGFLLTDPTTKTPELYPSIEIIDDENSSKTTDSMKIQFLI
jgi:hypothetical protein